MTESARVITQSRHLEALCQELRSRPFVTVDTEFMRQTTYRPKLCLIQLAAEGIEAAIDPLAEVELRPFFELMADQSIIKVFHAARQDVEIIYQESGVIPMPLFDTQIAAMALGFGEAVSYGALVKKLLKRNHDKTYQATDWSIRPIPAKQLDYALGDVTFLRDIYKKLQQRLEETGRESWLEEEVAILTDPKTYAFDPADAWKRLKLGGKSRLSRAIIIELAAWRERTAQIENLPRARVLKDEVIYEVAKHAPRSLEALGRLRPVREVLKSRGEAILSCVEEAIAAPSIKAEHAAAHAELSATESATVELLRVLAKAVAAELNVAPRLIASSDDLEKLAQQECPDIPAMKGWRYEIFGERAMALKEGRLALGLKDGQVTFCTL